MALRHKGNTVTLSIYKDHTWYILADFQTGELKECLEIQLGKSSLFSSWIMSEGKDKLEDEDKRICTFTLPFQFIQPKPVE